MLFYKMGRKITLIFLMAAVFSAASVFAASTLTFNAKDPSDVALSASQIKDNNLLDAFWANPAGNDPTEYGTGKMKIAAGPAEFDNNPANLINLITDNPTDNLDKYFAYKTPVGYYFWRFNSDAAPGATIYTRLWNDTAKSYYYYSSFANGALADSPYTMTVLQGDWYKAAKPYTPSITKFEEVSSTIPPAQTKTSSLKVYSAAGSGDDGKREVQTISWKWGKEKTKMEAVGENNPVLEIPSGSLVVGTTYFFQVTHTNWFDSAGSSSLIADYTVSGAAGAGAAGALFYKLNLFSNVDGTNSEIKKLGINSFSLPFPAPWYIYSEDGKSKILFTNSTGVPSTNEVTTAYDLIAAINASKATAVVSTFGKWDADNQKIDGAKLLAFNPNNTEGTLVLKTEKLSQGVGYQIYVTQGVRLVIKNQ